jgi:hypothetical protein
MKLQDHGFFLLLACKCLSLLLSSSHLMSNDAHINGCHRHSSSNSVTAFCSLSGVIMTAWCYVTWLITGTVIVVVGRKLQGKNKEALLSYSPTDVPESSSSSLCPSAWLLYSSTYSFANTQGIQILVIPLTVPSINQWWSDPGQIFLKRNY